MALVENDLPLTDQESDANAHQIALWFLVNEESGELQAHYDPAANQSLTQVMLRNALQDAGLDGFKLIDSAVNDFLAHAQKTKQILIWVIAKRRDGECRLRLSADLMQAYLTIIPPEGGVAVTSQDVDAVLRQLGVTYGVKHQAIADAVALGECEDVVVAEGDVAKEGVPTQFINLLDEKREQLSHIDENAVVKFRDLSHLLIVQPGDKLLRRVPPIPGVNGIDIKGGVAFPQALPDLHFGHDYPGAAPHPEDPDLLIAQIEGQPVPTGYGMMVNPVIDVPQVDLSVGNINFDGTLHVHGDVIAGMQIKVSGDVIIQGTLEAAQIEAGGNVAVSGGIIGHADLSPGASSLPADTARVICKGSLQALFIECAHIEAGDSIYIERSVRQCELIALNDIVVGNPGSKNSQIIGGSSQARHMIKANVMGAPSGVKTRLQVGLDPYAGKAIVQKQALINKKNEELDKLIKLLKFYKANPKKADPAVMAKIISTGQLLQEELAVLNQELAQLNEGLQVDEDAHIEANRAVFYGAEARIGKQVWVAKDDMGSATLGLVDGQLVTGYVPKKKEEKKEPEKVQRGPARFG
ncbi:FapA family protein [Massilia sp. W12]|uniref:DUF342 domain-containing protein n=1 Tax=Massilia sp. W12 TaxID=3126507 RepID=UPI0030CC2324